MDTKGLSCRATVVVLFACFIAFGASARAEEIKDPVVRELVRQLREVEPGKQSAVLISLSQMDTAPAVEAILDGMDPNHMSDFRAGMWALSSSSDPNTTTRMIDVIGRLAYSENADIRGYWFTGYDAARLGMRIGLRADGNAVRPLMRWVRTGNPGQAYTALHALSWCAGPKEALALLAEPGDGLAIPRNDHVGLRTTLLPALGRMGHSAVVEHLAKLAHNSGDEQERSDAVMALGIVGDANAVDALVTVLRDEPLDRIRIYAGKVLAALPYTPPEDGPGPRVGVLRAILDSDENSPLRNMAARALAQLGDRKSLPRIREVARESLSQAPPGVKLDLRRCGAVMALVSLEDPCAIEILRELDYLSVTGKRRLFELLSEHRLSGIDRLIMEKMWPATEEGHSRRRLVVALGSCAKQATEKKQHKRLKAIRTFILKELKKHDESPDGVVGELAKVAAQTDATSAVKPLLAHLKHTDDAEGFLKAMHNWSRREIFTALGQLGDANALGELQNRFQVDAPALMSLIGAMDKLGAKDLPKRLLPMTYHEDFKIRLTAIWGGSLQPTPAVVERLRELLKSPAGIYRQAAVLQLAKIPDRVSLPVLRRLARTDPSGRVRASAACALGKMNDPSAAALIRRGLRNSLSRDATIYVHAAATTCPKKAGRWIARYIRRRRGRVAWPADIFTEAPPEVIRPILAELRRWDGTERVWLIERLREQLARRDGSS